MEHQDRRHVLLATFPVQGHINPSLRFARRLIGLGVEVTFVTSVFAHGRMSKCKASGSGHPPKGLRFAVFSDGYDDGFKRKNDNSDHNDAAQQYLSELKRRGSDALRDVIQSSADQGRPVTRLVYTLMIPWVAKVARELHVPSALLWIQPALVLDIYYYYFHGHEDDIKKSTYDPNGRIQLPAGLPSLETRDLPSFLIPSSSEIYSFALPGFKEQLDILDEEEKPKILVNTFEALELEALKAIEKYNTVGIGPLVPITSDSDQTSSSSFGDLFQTTKDYRDWLNSKPAASVIYVSFGSILDLKKQQMEQIARALLDTGRPFLWVIRAKEKGAEEEQEEEEKFSCTEELEQNGMIVPWCSQIEVLKHPSLGCFVTHCGWNSSLESIVYGVPVIAFPQWTDQCTNAKLLEDVWKTGVRVRANKDGIVESDEIKKCIELVMEDEDGGKATELRKNAEKWKDLAREAVTEGGSSDKNLRTFLEEIGKE